MSSKQANKDFPICDQAVAFILKGLEYMCGGFMLAPSEVINLLQIQGDTREWYLDPKVYALKKALAKLYIIVDISNHNGMRFQRHLTCEPYHQPEILLQ